MINRRVLVGFFRSFNKNFTTRTSSQPCQLSDNNIKHQLHTLQIITQFFRQKDLEQMKSFELLHPKMNSTRTQHCVSWAATGSLKQCHSGLTHVRKPYFIRRFLSSHLPYTANLHSMPSSHPHFICCRGREGSETPMFLSVSQIGLVRIMRKRIATNGIRHRSQYSNDRQKRLLLASCTQGVRKCDFARGGYPGFATTINDHTLTGCRHYLLLFVHLHTATDRHHF